MSLRNFPRWMELADKIGNYARSNEITPEEKSWLVENTIGLWCADVYAPRNGTKREYEVIGPKNVIRMEFCAPIRHFPEMEGHYAFFPAKPYEGFMDIVRMIRGWEAEDFLQDKLDYVGSAYAPNEKALMGALQANIPGRFRMTLPPTNYERWDHVEERAAIKQGHLRVDAAYFRWSANSD